jgi:hypothetical protein
MIEATLKSLAEKRPVTIAEMLGTGITRSADQEIR